MYRLALLTLLCLFRSAVSWQDPNPASTSVEQGWSRWTTSNPGPSPGTCPPPPPEQTVTITITPPPKIVTVTTGGVVTSTTTETVTITTGSPLCGGGTTHVTNYFGNVTTTITSTTTVTGDTTTTQTIYLPAPNSTCCGGGGNGSDIFALLVNFLEKTYITEINRTISQNILQDFSTKVNLTCNVNASFVDEVTATVDDSLKYYLNLSNITLDARQLNYLNTSIVGVLMRYLDYQFREGDSSWSQHITTIITSHENPWWAILILALVLFFGFLTLAGLLWLICFRKTKVHKKGQKEEICGNCGRPHSVCMGSCNK